MPSYGRSDMVFREVHCMHWQRHCQHAAGIPISPSASSLGDWWLPGFVGGGRTCQAVSWWPGWTQPIQLHLTSGREQKSCASELSKWHSVGLVVCVLGWTETAEIWYGKKKKNEPPLPIRIPSKMTLRGSVAKKTELFSFLQAPVMFALVLPRISCGRVRICLFPVLISHSLPLHFPSFSFSCFYPLPDRMSSRKSELSA